MMVGVAHKRENDAMVAREFTIPLALVLIGLLTYLLIAGRLSQWGFAAGLVGSAVVILVIGVVVPKLERVPESGVKTSGGELLVRMEQIHKDVYAKVATVQRLAEEVGRIAAFATTNGGRVAQEDLDEILLEKHRELIQLLNSAGIADTRSQEIAQPIMDTIERDLANEVANAAWRALNKQARGLRDSGLFNSDVRTLLRVSHRGEASGALRPYLEGMNAWDDKVAGAVRAFDNFRTTRTLSARQVNGGGS